MKTDVLRVAETNTSTYYYHLVRATTDHQKQGELDAICDKVFKGWETKIPIRAWGKLDHLHSRWCRGCTNELKRISGERP